MSFLKALALTLAVFACVNPAASAKPFYDYCVAPASDAQYNTVLAVMFKMRLWDRPSERNCAEIESLLKQKSFLNIWPDPFDPARGPASDLSPLEEQYQLRNLSIAKNEITDLSPLKPLQELLQLNMSYNPIRDISTLASLRKLREVIAAETLVEDLSPLTKLMALESVNFSKTRVTDISALAGHPLLNSVYVDHNEISDASALATLRLKYLQIAANQVADLDLTLSKDTMRMLDASGNQLTTVRGIDQFKAIDAIGLARNKIVSLKTLSELRTLRWLDLRDNQITDLTPLSGLTSLEYLLIDGNNICDIPVAVLALQEEHLNHKGQWIRLKIDIAGTRSGCAK
jgi:Leucine-rich repeat (LRR) protein